MSFLTELAKRAAMKTASKVSQEIPTAAERTVGALVPHQAQALSPLQAAAKVITPEVAPKIAKEGLESPGRRRILKQMASTAARASVPDHIANRLMKMATSPLDEGIARAATEANLPQMVDPNAVSGIIHEFLSSGNMLDEFHDVGNEASMAPIIQHIIKNFYPQDNLPHLNSALEKLKKLSSSPIEYDSNFGSIKTDLNEARRDLAYYKAQGFPEDIIRDKEEYVKELLSIPKEHNLPAWEIKHVRDSKLESEHYPKEMIEWAQTIPEGSSGYFGPLKSTLNLDLGQDLWSGDLSKFVQGKFKSDDLVSLPNATKRILKGKIGELQFSPQEIQSLKLAEDHMPLTGELLDERGLNFSEAPTDSLKSFQRWLDSFGN